MKNLTFDCISKDAKSFVITEGDSYVDTYPEFLKFFTNLKEITYHDLVISSHFVYGWMPTIIQLRIGEKKEVLGLLNEVKNGAELEIDQLEILKGTINNSMVGLSKLLHFINPKIYAIWDSRILRYITEHKSDSGISDPKNYLKYLCGIKEIKGHQNFPELHKLIQENFTYQIEPSRAIEIVMFEADRKNQAKIKGDNNA